MARSRHAWTGSRPWVGVHLPARSEFGGAEARSASFKWVAVAQVARSSRWLEADTHPAVLELALLTLMLRAFVPN